jgi:plasmid stability protein
MSVTLSIERLPDHVAAELRRRAAEHHRSPEGEAMATLEASLATERRVTTAELRAKVKAMGLRSPCESVAMLREAMQQELSKAGRGGHEADELAGKGFA